ncbi:hypothetical protein [Nostoc sp. CMAA1605]|uniref:hypothetical protein n=1 Tax=Nostoc sp. CMAA1605 TaxID=2055159 RepID=UPI001F192290|nr:hypothetical protein [Nostoc sp. CMAA1605]
MITHYSLLPTHNSPPAKRRATANTTQHSTLNTQHSTLSTQHSALSTLLKDFKIVAVSSLSSG